MASAGILGTGTALPEKVITNFDLEKLVDTSDQWITDRTGIKERRQAAPGETTSSLSVRAAHQALDMAGLKPQDLDLIICSTISPDMPLPSTAALIQRDLGARGCCASIRRVSHRPGSTGRSFGRRPADARPRRNPASPECAA